MIKLTDDWAIEKDIYCFMLIRRIVSGEKSRTPGEEKWQTEGYYSDIQQAIRGMVNKELFSEEKAGEFEEMFKSSLERVVNMVIKAHPSDVGEEIVEK